MTAVVAIGCSLGGLDALTEVLTSLPGSFPSPVVVVQHRGADHDDGRLAGRLQRNSSLPVLEVADKDPVAAGHVYIAPADYHLMVTEDGFELSTEGRVSHSRPSIDVLFESVAFAFGRDAVGVLLTGTGRDGARGLRMIEDAGGTVVAQDPSGARAPGMPGAGIEATVAPRILPLAEIGPFLTKIAGEA